jgi:hypothetical protein
LTVFGQNRGRRRAEQQGYGGHPSRKLHFPLPSAENRSQRA